MDQRFFHGSSVSPERLAQSLEAEFNQGNLRAQIVGGADRLAVQIGTRYEARSGGTTALTVSIEKVPDGVMVRMGQQEWLGTAASLGRATIAALMNPWTLLGNLDDIAQDVENIQLTARVWQAIDGAARAMGATQQLSERLARLTCEYCGVANPVGEAACIACGAPLGSAQPMTCKQCGFVVQHDETRCPNCGAILTATLNQIP